MSETPPILFSNHAINRFIERFPEENLESVFERSTPINMKYKSVFLEGNRKCDLAYLDPITYAVFIIVKYKFVKNKKKVRELKKEQYKCVTVIRGKFPDEYFLRSLTTPQVLHD